MSSALGLVLTGIFMLHLESTLITKSPKHFNPWKRYLGETISIIKETSIEFMKRMEKSHF